MAFFYGYKPTTILLDEPDAHLHVNLQREILDYFKNQNSRPRNTQFLIATHAEEFIKGVDVRQIISLLDMLPKRVEATPAILTAMADVSNLEITQLAELENPVILYIEGETDERIIRSWATALEMREIIEKVCFRLMGGGNKKKMKGDSDRHFQGIQQIIPLTKRLMLFDYDDEERAFHPQPDNLTLHEWNRKNIENYLLVPEAWIRAASQTGSLTEQSLFSAPIQNLIRDFFARENLTLPPAQSWRNVRANIFQVVNGKKLLFENQDSLFQCLINYQLPAHIQSVPALELTREIVATNMLSDEIHEDVHQFFAKLGRLISPTTGKP